MSEYVEGKEIVVVMEFRDVITTGGSGRADQSNRKLLKQLR